MAQLSAYVTAAEGRPASELVAERDARLDEAARLLAAVTARDIKLAEQDAEIERLRGFMKWLTKHGSAREMKDGGTAEEYSHEDFTYKDDFLEEFCDD